MRSAVTDRTVVSCGPLRRTRRKKKKANRGKTNGKKMEKKTQIGTRTERRNHYLYNYYIFSDSGRLYYIIVVTLFLKQTCPPITVSIKKIFSFTFNLIRNCTSCIIMRLSCTFDDYFWPIGLPPAFQSLITATQTSIIITMLTISTSHFGCRQGSSSRKIQKGVE